MEILRQRNYGRVAATVLLLLFTTLAFAQKKGYTVKLTVTERGSREAVVMGTVNLQPSGAMAVTDMNGQAIIQNVPAGEYILNVSYVGFESINRKIRVDRDLDMKLQMTESSLALKEVTVTAKVRENGASTSSVIGRQAIDHLQATSLADIMQLIPGQLMGNHDLTNSTGSTLQLRSLSPNNTSAFGSSVVIDGMPMSNNGAMQTGSFSSANIVGTDLRGIAADDIQEVEVVRGIPSAEYGDLTSGLVIVQSKVGITPWQVKGKITPALQNYSVGKGFSLGSAGIVNANLDYAKAWSDPRSKTKSYGRYTLNLGYGFDISRKWHTNTKLRLTQVKEWDGKDPDAIQDGTENKNKNMTFGLTHNGRIQIDKPLMRSLKYTLGMSYTQIDNRSTSFRGGGMTEVITAMETGYNNIPWIMGTYLATGITESRPGNVFFKLSDDFFLRKGKTVQSFKVGVDYHFDWNNARGYYNEDESMPYRNAKGERPRAFRDIPGLHQLSAFAEDNFTYNINKVNRLRVNFGLRFTSMQPFSDLSTTALSPRLNVAFTAAKWLDLRGGIGMNSKTPGLMHLYPDKSYTDLPAANYMPQDDATAQLLNYHTIVYDVKRSTDLKNATTTKVEVGIDIKLPAGRKLSLLAYRDKTPNGFGPSTEWITYWHDTFTPGQGLVVTPGAATQVDYNNPASHNYYYMTTGKIGNTNTTVNRGAEFDFDLGELRALHTSLYFSGAWSETKTWSTNLNTNSPNIQRPDGTLSSWTPFKLIYPSGEDFSRYRRFVNTLRIVTNIPKLKMVASLTGQVIWYNSNWSYTSDKDPIGWIDSNLERHDITSAMLNGYLGFDGKYYENKGTDQSYVSLADERKQTADTEPSKDKVTWNTSARLTKELGKVGGLSFYVNNALFYEPFLSGNKTTTLTQRNKGTFSFGAELYLNL